MTGGYNTLPGIMTCAGQFSQNSLHFQSQEYLSKIAFQSQSRICTDANVHVYMPQPHSRLRTKARICTCIFMWSPFYKSDMIIVVFSSLEYVTYNSNLMFSITCPSCRTDWINQSTVGWNKHDNPCPVVMPTRPEKNVMSASRPYFVLRQNMLNCVDSDANLITYKERIASWDIPAEQQIW